MNAEDTRIQLPFPQPVIPADRMPLVLRQSVQIEIPSSVNDNYDNNIPRPFCSNTVNGFRQRGVVWLRCLGIVVSDAPIVPAARIFYYTFRYVPNQDNEELGSPIPDLSSRGLRIVSRRYQIQAEGMLKAWETIKLTSLFFIGAAPVILQIEPIYTNVVPRACTIASGFFSLASMVTSHIYVQAKERFMYTRAMEERWRRSANNSDATFWKLMALPFAFILWSFVFFLGTVGYFIWGIAFAVSPIGDSGTGNQEKGIQYTELLLSATFVTSIPIYAFYKIYNAMSEIHAS